MSWIDTFLRQIATQLFSSDLNPVAYPLVFAGGLLNNFCPCGVALIPLVVGYIGGISREKERGKTFLYSASFTAGIVTTLCLLGALAASLGTFLAPLGEVSLFLVAAISLVIGLHCIGLYEIKLFQGERFEGLWLKTLERAKGTGGSFLLGLTAGVIAAPCTTPVLAVILAYVAVKARFFYGLSLLFTYSLGFAIPLLLAGIFVGFIATLKRWNEKTNYHEWIVKGSGMVLILFGLYLLGKGILVN